MRAIVLLVLWVATLVTVESHGADNELMLSLVRKAESDVTDLTAPLALWRSTAFVEIAVRSASLRQQALSVISLETSSEVERQIAVYGMQSLQREDYVQFFLDAAELYRAKKCSAEILALIIDPGFDWGCTIVSNYRSHRIAVALRQIAENAKSDETLREIAENIASGARYERFLEYMEAESQRGKDERDAAFETWKRSEGGKG